jgi:hypothetical protein
MGVVNALFIYKSYDRCNTDQMVDLCLTLEVSNVFRKGRTCPCKELKQLMSKGISKTETEEINAPKGSPSPTNRESSLSIKRVFFRPIDLCISLFLHPRKQRSFSTNNSNMHRNVLAMETSADSSWPNETGQRRPDDVVRCWQT